MSKCAESAEHRAHIAFSGECPWCGSVDKTGVREDLTVEEIEAMFG